MQVSKLQKPFGRFSLFDREFYIKRVSPHWIATARGTEHIDTESAKKIKKIKPSGEDNRQRTGLKGLVRSDTSTLPLFPPPSPKLQPPHTHTYKNHLFFFIIVIFISNYLLQHNLMHFFSLIYHPLSIFHLII